MGLERNAMAATVESTNRAAGVEALPRRMAAASPPPNRERLFAKARRRSGRVRVLRKTILIGAVGLVAAMVVIAIFDPFGPKSTSLTFSQLSLDGTKVAMAKPRLAGFRSDGEPYVLTAERALQDLKHPTVAELQNLAGDMGSAGGETSRLTADAGVYDSVAQRMQMTGNVKIQNARFNVLLRSVDIDFKTGVYKSSEPVEVHLGGGTTINADRATAENNGQELTFEGRVRTTVIPQGDAANEAQTKRTTP
jgi:lipopolysaccharide export system protein LptC